jgi:bifunctional non-homologous end joining protein LigD
MRTTEEAPRSAKRRLPRGGTAKAEPYAAPALRALAQAARDVTLELEGGDVALTHLDKELWPAAGELPAYTRLDYVRYLLLMAPHLLRHLRYRPLTLIRQPAGVTGRRFVHFHYEQRVPEFVETVDIYSEKAGRAEQYLLCNNAATLIWLAHVGSLEFHAWHSRITAGPDAKDAQIDFRSSRHALEQSVLNFPDYIVCDLDPYIYSGAEPAGAQPAFNAGAFARCKEVAFSLKDLLDSMRLHALVKTSGKTGLHILVPIARTVTFEAARALAHEIGKHLVAKHPELVTTDQRVSQRTGKIFFDFGMNARVKTLIAPYSVRGVVGAPVAMPIEWDDLEQASPMDFTMANVPQILARRGDIWENMLATKQDLQRILADQGAHGTAP